MKSYSKMVQKESKCALNAALFGVVLNLVLPMIVAPFATEEEKMPKNGVASLSMKGQIMHMLVHHQQVPVTSSLIIFAIVFLSVQLGYMFKIF